MFKKLNFSVTEWIVLGIIFTVFGVSFFFIIKTQVSPDPVKLAGWEDLEKPDGAYCKFYYGLIKINCNTGAYWAKSSFRGQITEQPVWVYLGRQLGGTTLLALMRRVNGTLQMMRFGGGGGLGTKIIRQPYNSMSPPDDYLYAALHLADTVLH